MLRRSSLLAIALLSFSFASRAEAHFILQQPAAYSEQGLLGDPQKAPPCGEGSGQTVTETGEVTTYEAGSTITIGIDETIAHPGHYRVSIAQDQASLPADPPVTAGSTACGSTVIAQNPTLPLLADGLLVHTSDFGAPQTMQVKLPAGMTCDHCVLQVAEFMSNHGLNNPGGCFYHHCAIVSIVPAGSGPDGGPGDADAAVDPGADDGDGGCGCRAAARRGGTGAGGAWLGAVVLGALAWRRRRRA